GSAWRRGVFGQGPDQGRSIRGVRGPLRGKEPRGRRPGRPSRDPARVRDRRREAGLHHVRELRHQPRGRGGDRPARSRVLRPPAETLRAVEAAAPDRVYHLAAQSNVRDSFENPLDTVQNNIAATLNVLEAVRTRAPHARVLVVGSAEVYGNAEGGRPIDEHAE